MQALIFDPERPSGIRLGQAPEPVPTSSQVLVEVHAISLNFGDVMMLKRGEPGSVPGWDASGVVIQAAANGSGPAIGTRVSSFGWGGAWAERRAVDVKDIGIASAEIDFGAASALPVAGVTALRALRALGPLLGRRVLVTGASGGVGRYAVQLARIAGADVVASVGSAHRGEGLESLGAGKVVVGLGSVTELFDGIIDNVGGQTLSDAMNCLAAGGVLQSVGGASMQPSTIDFMQQRLPDGRRAAGRRIEVFAVGADFGPDLSYLLSLVERGQLDPCIGWRGSWRRADEAIEALMGRHVNGKAVLDLRESPQ